MRYHLSGVMKGGGHSSIRMEEESEDPGPNSSISRRKKVVDKGRDILEPRHHNAVNLGTH